MKEIKSTLDGVLLTDERGSGNTTRQIDAAIQHLFNGYAVKCISHGEPNSREANRFLAEKIIDRLEAEHPHAKYYYILNDNTIYLK